tara:strand:+ start:462 stop:716 length:255 start_codon:yes stop_codon:yes gene_type:complete
MRPVNRRLLVKPYQEKEDKNSFIIPEEYQEKTHVSFEVLVTASDCALGLKEGDVVIAHSTDPEIIIFEGKQYHLLLENRVVCVS